MYTDCKYKKITVEYQDGRTLIDENFDDEPLFVFRAQDKLAPIALVAYIETLYAIDQDKYGEMIHHIEEHLEGFRAWTPRRLPD